MGVWDAAVYGGMDPVFAVGLGGLALVAAWAAANGRHVRRREGRGAEWDGADARADLWTSAARCPACGSRGGVLEVSGIGLEFVCLACGQRHNRDTKG